MLNSYILAFIISIITFLAFKLICSTLLHTVVILLFVFQFIWGSPILK